MRPRSGSTTALTAALGAGLIFVVFIAFAIPAALAGDAGDVTIDVTVDWDEAHQTIVGFGGTMGWIHPGDAVRDEVFDLLFTKLDASLLRVRALGGEGGDELSIEPKNDNDDPAAFNWPAFPVRLTEARNAAIIRAALERGVRTVVPASWSPPGWMKTTGRRAGGGTLADGMLDEFAEAWAAYVIGMRREFGIRLEHLSIQNEPDLAYIYPTCRFAPELHARAKRAVQERLDREGLGVGVLGPDTCRIYNMPDYVAEEARLAASSGGGARERGDDRDDDPEPERARDPILTHLYDLSIPYERVDRDAERWRAAREVARAHGRPLWLMETANFMSGTEPASWDEGLIWARKIHHALADGDCEVVCYWSLYFDKRGEALIYAARSDTEDYEITPKYYTSMNFYRFVRPGMVRVGAGAPDADLFVTAFRGPAAPGGEGDPPEPARSEAPRPPSPVRVVVIVNWSGSARRVRLPFAPGEAWERHESSATRNCERLAWTPPFTTLPPRSVTTFSSGRRDARDGAAGFIGAWRSDSAGSRTRLQYSRIEVRRDGTAVLRIAPIWGSTLGAITVRWTADGDVLLLSYAATLDGHVVDAADPRAVLTERLGVLERHGGSAVLLREWAPPVRRVGPGTRVLGPFHEGPRPGETRLYTRVR